MLLDPPYVPVKDVPVKRPSKPVWNLPEESPDIEFLRTSRVFPPLASTEEAVLMRIGESVIYVRSGRVRQISVVIGEIVLEE